MRLEDYKSAMEALETDNLKYEKLIAAIECDEYRVRRKAIIAGAAAISTAAVLGAAAAAESGFFTSIQKAFYSGNNNGLIASEPSEYAFIPEVDSVCCDDIKINITEAAVDDYCAVVFMDLVFENGVPQEILDDKANDYNNICFEHAKIGNDEYISSKCISVEDNAVSMYVISQGAMDEDWQTNGITLDFGTLGYMADTLFADFKAVSEISGNVTIPSEQVKFNESRKSDSEIEGIPVKLDLSLFGVGLIMNSKEDYDTINDIITQKTGFISSNAIDFYMKDGSRKGREDYYKLLNFGSYGRRNDGTYWMYVGFSAPLDIEQIEKITVGGYEFIME